MYSFSSPFFLGILLQDASRILPRIRGHSLGRKPPSFYRIIRIEFNQGKNIETVKKGWKESVRKNRCGRICGRIWGRIWGRISVVFDFVIARRGEVVEFSGLRTSARRGPMNGRKRQREKKQGGLARGSKTGGGGEEEDRGKAGGNVVNGW